MKTVLYNTQLNAVVSNPTANTIEIPLIEHAKPEHSIYQYLVLRYELKDMQYHQIWEVADKTDYEIALLDWLFPEYEFRLRGPKILGQKYPNIYVHILLEPLPIVPAPGDDFVDVYINTVLPEHGEILRLEQDIVEIHSRPVMLKTL